MPSDTTKKLLIGIPVAALLLNGAGYLIFSMTRSSSKTSATSTAASTAPAPGEATAPAEAPRPAGEATAPPTDDKTTREAMARRNAGMKALDGGDYDRALINFTEARSLAGEKANVTDLIRITENLRNQAAQHKTTRAASAEPAAAEPSRPSRRSGRSRASTAELAPMDDSEPATAPAPAPGGTLIVTTVPRGLLVHVDDLPIDLTPMKTSVKPGLHRVALLDGSRRVYETRVDVKEGGTSAVIEDLSSQLQPEAAHPAVAAVPAAPAPKSVAAAEPESAPPAAAPVAASPKTAPEGEAPAPDAGKSKTVAAGTLDITSPGLYGVVWVNGRPRGYSPLKVANVPAGTAKIEVRVNGVEKRASTVNVRAGEVVPVRLTSAGVP